IMNPQETQQVVARDEKWVPSTERVKISSTNVRLETTMFLKSLCSSSGTQSRRSKNMNLMNSSWPTRSALSIVKSLDVTPRQGGIARHNKISIITTH
ncbi:hypothetical protein Tco_1089406, partial [Tanacetum coccineum]